MKHEEQREMLEYIMRLAKRYYRYRDPIVKRCILTGVRNNIEFYSILLSGETMEQEARIDCNMSLSNSFESFLFWLRSFLSEDAATILDQEVLPNEEHWEDDGEFEVEDDIWLESNNAV